MSISQLKAISATKQSDVTEFHINLSDVEYELLLCSLHFANLEIKKTEREWDKIQGRAK